MILPPMIGLPGSTTYQQPIPMAGNTTQVFVLKASYDQLKITTDEWFNNVPNSPYQFVPLLPYVLCCPYWIDRITWSPPGAGWMRETDFFFAYPVACFRDGLLDHVAIAHAFMIVDNPVAVASGREIFGYRKVYGQMDYVAGTYQPRAASTWLFKEWGENQELQLEEVARIFPPDGWASMTRKTSWDDVRQIVGVEAGDLAFDAATALEHLITFFSSCNLPVVYLLQVRDVEFPTSAGYQAIIESPMQITTFDYAWILPPGFTIQLTDYASYPVISSLGIEVDANNVATPVFAYQCNFDCVLQPGKVLTVGGRTAG